MDSIDVVQYIILREGTKDLFWDYPFNAKYQEWEPTMPPDKGHDGNIFAIPKRGWSTLWDKYEGIGFGANFDHWEALIREVKVRPKDKDIILHKVVRKPYQPNLV